MSQFPKILGLTVDGNIRNDIYVDADGIRTADDAPILNRHKLSFSLTPSEPGYIDKDDEKLYFSDAVDSWKAMLKEALSKPMIDRAKVKEVLAELENMSKAEMGPIEIEIEWLNE